ncbi:MAG TPA: class I SAM-dependent methyltransferase [Actinomycetota bacterium]|nr:class I SAM-dependent methyltransferase [Actinomycetota bacterium]
MDEYDASTYGDRIAPIYDELIEGKFDTEGAVTFLAELAGTGPILELGIGTGRVALPLAERGLEVHGIDASGAMVEKLRAKPGGDRITITLNDFAGVDVEGAFSLVFVVFNTLFALATQDDQVRCFGAVADRLTPDGVFVMEAFVPDLSRFGRYHQRVEAGDLSVDRVRLEVARHDPVNQRIDGQHVVISETETKLYPVHLRYAWPSELNLMARLAGLRLRERWGSWRRDPFTESSERHISVYGRTNQR